ncbi:MAG: hypothetical protein JW734_06515 [Candidatus Omnitrophica bacterium]|nr:hypothetical protein [Candidatus Omnitrophota bacterium]
MEKIYAVFEGKEIWRISENKNELIRYRDSFPEDRRKNMVLAEKTIGGPRGNSKGHWKVDKEVAMAQEGD